MIWCAFKFLGCSQTWSSSTEGGFHFPSPCIYLLWLRQYICLEHFLVKTKAKKSREYLSLLCVPGNHIPCFLPERDHIFPKLSLIHQGTWRSFPCCPLRLWADLILLGFRFPNMIPGSSDILYITLRLPVLVSTLCRLPSFVCQQVPCPSTQASWHFCLTSLCCEVSLLNLEEVILEY